MAGLRQEISVLIVPHYGGKPREWRFSLLGLRMLAALGGLLLMIALVIVALATRIHIRQFELRTLRARNAELEQQVGRLTELQQELAAMKQQYERIRTMLGMDLQPAKPQLEQLLLTLVQDSSPESTSREETADSVSRVLVSGTGVRIPSIPPLTGYQISRRHSRTHPGIDLVAELGTPIIAPADGIVISIAWDTIYGNSMTIQHNREYRTFYGHLHRIARVTGDSVRQGQVIGFVGSTGRSTGPHLHYEVLKGKIRLDPEKYFQ